MLPLVVLEFSSPYITPLLPVIKPEPFDTWILWQFQVQLKYEPILDPKMLILIEPRPKTPAP